MGRVDSLGENQTGQDFRFQDFVLLAAHSKHSEQHGQRADTSVAAGSGQRLTRFCIQFVCRAQTNLRKIKTLQPFIRKNLEKKNIAFDLTTNKNNNIAHRYKNYNISLWETKFCL